MSTQRLEKDVIALSPGQSFSLTCASLAAGDLQGPPASALHTLEGTHVVSHHGDVHTHAEFKIPNDFILHSL